MSKPITKEDIRFTELWREQRKGSKIGYYLLYTFSWGLAIIFIVFFVLMFLGGISIIPIAQDNNKIVLIVVVGFILGLGTTVNDRFSVRLTNHLFSKAFEKGNNFSSYNAQIEIMFNIFKTKIND